MSSKALLSTSLTLFVLGAVSAQYDLRKYFLHLEVELEISSFRSRFVANFHFRFLQPTLFTFAIEQTHSLQNV